MINGSQNTSCLSSEVKNILKLMADGPVSIARLSREISLHDANVYLDEMLTDGLISVISLTPTDLLHINGEYRRYNHVPSERCLNLIAARMDIDAEEFTSKLIDRFVDQMTFALTGSALEFDGKAEKGYTDSDWLYKAMFESSGKARLRCDLDKKIVAIGAPAGAWLTKLGPVFGTEGIVPENFEVANAIGAASGMISTTFEAAITFRTDENIFAVHLPWGMKQFEVWEDAEEYAIAQMNEHADIAEKEFDYSDAKITRTINSEKKYLSKYDNDNRPYKITLTMKMETASKYFA